MTGKLLAHYLQSSVRKVGCHMMGIRILPDYHVEEVELAGKEAIAVQRGMELLYILEDKGVFILDHEVEQGKELNLNRKGP